VSRLNGAKLPSWLRYVPDTRMFLITAAPEGALPIEVLVRIGGRSWKVLITGQQ
jgi:hypothetical protein